jgi:hypothetical protein
MPFSCFVMLENAGVKVTMADAEIIDNFFSIIKRFNNIRILSSVPNSAPLSSHLRTRSCPIPVGQDRSSKHILAAFDADLGSKASASGMDAYNGARNNRCFCSGIP